MTKTEPASPPLTIDSIFVGKEFRSESYSQPRWWDSGSCYTALLKSDRKPAAKKDKSSGLGGSNGGGSSVRDLIWHDVATNTSETHVSAELLIPPGHDVPLHVDDYALSPDKSRLLIFTNAVKVWRKKTRGDYWVLVRF